MTTRVLRIVKTRRRHRGEIQDAVVGVLVVVVEIRPRKVPQAPAPLQETRKSVIDGNKLSGTNGYICIKMLRVNKKSQFAKKASPELFFSPNRY